MPLQGFSPKVFLQDRSPECFSDSVGRNVPILERSFLEYHLDTLTSRSAELLFEAFTRRLLELTVCPNLLPHTGPTGGGDSKVDTETYPVAEILTFAWYIGIGNQAATERWGFAFSAMKDWRKKLIIDIAKIAKTGRGYTKAFFVSNQFIKDKKRAEIEDKLRKKHGLDVRIFDRTWILDKVFGGHYEQVAIDELGIKTSIRREVRKGPLDTKREYDIGIIETRIAAALQENRCTPNLVDDCLEVANLARRLECPRVEIEGLYGRAERLAKQYGTLRQQVQSAHDYACTAFWWLEDYKLFANLYTDVETRARGSRNIYDLEQWTNLFLLLNTAVSCQGLKAETIDIPRRMRTLFVELDRLAAEHSRPSAALQARTLRLTVGLINKRPDKVEAILRELVTVVRESESLVGFPLEPLVRILTELGIVLGELPAFEQVFETIVQTTSRREGEVSAARMLMIRGAQYLDTNHPYEAIRTLGRALGRLYKHESRHDIVQALYLCGRAYERVGLLWAARGTMLAAASIATNEFWTYEKATPQQAICYNRIKWLELRLGRLPHLLAWHELDRVVRAVLTDKGYSMERLLKYDEMFDPILGMLLLRTDLRALQELVKLPDMLDNIGLPGTAVALMYALGHDDKVPPELLGESPSADAKYKLFRMWRDQPAAKDIPLKPIHCTGQTLILTTNVLGCHITVDCWNQPPYVELGESVLAAIESFLATGVLEHIVARESNLTLNIRPSDSAEVPFNFKAIDQEGRPHIEISCRSFEPNKLDKDLLLRIKDRLFALIAHVIARTFAMSDPKTLLTKLFRDDLAPQRALDFTTSFIVVGNILGYEPKTTLASWISGDAKAYPLTREKIWDEGEQIVAKPVSEKRLKHAKAGVNTSAESAIAPYIAHNQIRTLSMIREVLWNDASWYGTAFGTSPNNESLPSIGLLFENRLPAEKIFALWRSELGPRDIDNKLRIAIIRGVNKDKPHFYRVLVGSNPDKSFSESEHIVFISRIHTMEPSTSENLMRFLKSSEVCKSYILNLGFMVGQQVNMVWDNHLIKQQLVVREAWEIGPHDIDAVAISENDDPIIPKGQKNAPVLMNLKMSRSGAHL